MATPTNANGHRRRQLVARVKAAATHCALCTQPLNPHATWPDPDCTVIDEDIPRAKGGSPLDPDNTNAMHNRCNRFKGTMTLTEARQAIQLGANIQQPMNKQQKQALLAPTIGNWEPASAVW